MPQTDKVQVKGCLFSVSKKNISGSYSEKTGKERLAGRVAQPLAVGGRHVQSAEHLAPLPGSPQALRAGAALGAKAPAPLGGSLVVCPGVKLGCG